MKFLVFDTETNGLPKNWKAPMSLLTNWPRVIQFAFTLFNEDGTTIESHTSLIKPNGWTVPKEKFWIENNHSTERCEEFGTQIEDSLSIFADCIKKCDYLVAHNMNFDYNVVGAEMIRAKMRAEKRPRICTMISTIDFCNLSSGYSRPKFPKLIELHNILFGKDFEGAHDAMDDVSATKKCFLELLKLQVIELL